MKNVSIYEELTDLFREIFSNDSIILAPQTVAADIEGWDSFNHISVIVAVETRFKIKFSTKEIESFSAISDLVFTIDLKIKSQSKIL